MKIIARRAVAALASVLCIGATYAPVEAADIIATAPSYRGQAPQACAQGWVLSRIAGKFRYQVTHVPNLPDVDLVDFRDIRQNRYEPAMSDSEITRTYCEATAYTSDGKRHAMWYLIEDGAGFAGLGDNVEFCLVNFDRWKVYNGRCRVLR
jgi:capsid protein